MQTDVAPMPPEPVSRTFHNSGLALHYLDWGPRSGDAVILVHGIRDHARSWDAIAGVLQAHHRVIALDLRGHGDSAWSPDGAYLLPYHVIDLAELVDQLGYRKVTLVGHSFGGSVVSRFAGLYPDRVEKLVVVDGSGPSAEIYAKWAQEGAPQRTRDWIVQRRALAGKPLRRLASLDEGIARMAQANPRLAPAQVAHLARHGMRADGDAFVWKHDPLVGIFAPEDFATPIVEYWREVTAPTLLCHGIESWSASAADDGRASALRDHRSVAIAGAGHWPHHDRTEYFNEMLVGFLDR